MEAALSAGCLVHLTIHVFTNPGRRVGLLPEYLVSTIERRVFRCLVSGHFIAAGGTLATKLRRSNP